MIKTTLVAAIGLLVLSGTAFAGGTNSQIILNNPASHNFAAIVQVGAHNKGVIVQNGSDNSAVAIQFGVGNTSVIVQN